MNAVGKLGSYISRSAYIVSGPFHPFGGAVDIIVVEQPDGSFKSSPWYVRFGKFQGFLQAREKLVGVSVNGVEADFSMYIDHRGEAYFLGEIDVEVPDNTISPPSVENTHGGSHSRSPMKSTSCTYEAHVAGTPRKSDAKVEKTMSRADSRGSRISGPGFWGKNSGFSISRTESLERAEIAADLLEMKWSTNLDYSTRKDNGISRLSSLDISEGNDVNQLNTDTQNTSVSHTYDTTQDTIAHKVFDNLPHPTTMEVSSEIDNLGVDDADTSTSMTYASPEIICTDTNNREFMIPEACLDPHDHKFMKSETQLVMDQDSPSLILVRNTVRSDTQNTGNSEVELLFGDLDDFRENETRHIKNQIFNDHEKDTQTETRGSQIKSDANEFFLPVSATNLGMKLRTVSSEINFRGLHTEEVMASRSLPNMWISDSDICGSGHYINHVLHSDYFPSDCTFLMNDDLNNAAPKVDNDHQPSKSLQLTEDSRSNQELKKEPRSPVVGNSSRPVDSSSGNWRFWPFLFRRSRSREVSESTLSLSINRSSSTENGIEDERDVPKVKLRKMKVRESTPSSAHLESLNLKEGRNTLTFTFSTPMLGKQKVDAQIHLWKWDTRIVISDVDGTITRSDLLGQVMPWVGLDWSQTGVANLFSAIKGNGYQVLFLSARAISQSYHTRQFIFNLKQDGKALPEGPVVISPDGLFPSLYREVVRRTPHEFKISCLEAIKALFPSDRNPFYAGFGNRDSDEISYLKVGIPKGKIFIINTKGEIAVNHRVDRKSYISFHSLVDDMFPVMSSSGQEDYNSWNYWKLPINTIDI